MTGGSSKPRTNSAARIYAIPAMLAVVSCVGLVAALASEGLWDVLSGIAVSLPLVVAAWRIGRSWTHRLD